MYFRKLSSTVILSAFLIVFSLTVISCSSDNPTGPSDQTDPSEENPNKTKQNEGQISSALYVQDYNEHESDESNKALDDGDNNILELVAPTNLRINLAGYTSNIQIMSCILEWIDTNNIEEGFIISRKEGFNGQWVELNRICNSTHCKDSSVIPEKIYYYRIRAFNENCCSDWSGVISFYSGSSYTVPEPSK